MMMNRELMERVRVGLHRDSYYALEIYQREDGLLDFEGSIIDPSARWTPGVILIYTKTGSVTEVRAAKTGALYAINGLEKLINPTYDAPEAAAYDAAYAAFLIPF